MCFCQFMCLALAGTCELSKRSVILDDEENKSRRRLLIERRVRRGYIGAKHRKNLPFRRVYGVCLTAR